MAIKQPTKIVHELYISLPKWNYPGQQKRRDVKWPKRKNGIHKCTSCDLELYFHRDLVGSSTRPSFVEPSQSKHIVHSSHSSPSAAPLASCSQRKHPLYVWIRKSFRTLLNFTRGRRKKSLRLNGWFWHTIKINILSRRWCDFSYDRVSWLTYKMTFTI